MYKSGYNESELQSALKKAQQLQKKEEAVPVAEEVPQKIRVINRRDNTITTSKSKCLLNPDFRRRQQLTISTNPNATVELTHSNVFSSHSQNTFTHSVNYNFPSQPIHQQTFPAVIPSTSTPFQPVPINVPAHHNNNIYLNPAVFNPAHVPQFLQQHGSSSGHNWDLMVDEFVKRTISDQRKYSPNRTRSSRSTSFSTTTSRSSSSEYDSAPKKKKLKESRSQSGPLTQQSLECAKAIGLDEAYLQKIEEQQRMREEIARKKRLHRKMCAEEPKKEQEGLNKETDQKISSEVSIGTLELQKTSNKLRPYLAVVVSNLSTIEDVETRLLKLASSVGSVKKIWQVTDNDCHIIFDKHEDAKAFMQRYLGNKNIFKGAVLDVEMKKVFLNLTTGT